MSPGDDYVGAVRWRSLSAAHPKKVTGTPVWTGAGSLSPESGPGRADAVEKAKKRWAEGIKGKGQGGRFLKGDQGAVHLNEDAIRKDEPFDGRHGGWTRLESETPSQV